MFVNPLEFDGVFDFYKPPNSKVFIYTKLSETIGQLTILFYEIQLKKNSPKIEYFYSK
jgi:hypothetical protein